MRWHQVWRSARKSFFDDSRPPFDEPPPTLRSLIGCLHRSWWVAVPIIATITFITLAAIRYLNEPDPWARGPIPTSSLWYWLATAFTAIVVYLMLALGIAVSRQPHWRLSEWRENWELACRFADAWEFLLRDRDDLCAPSLASVLWWSEQTDDPEMPSDTALVKQYVFCLGVGATFEDYAEYAPKLPGLLSSDLVSITPGVSRADQFQPSSFYFTAEKVTEAFWEWADKKRPTWENRRNAGVGLTPATAYLDPEASTKVVDFLLRRQLGEVLSELGLEYPLPTRVASRRFASSEKMPVHLRIWFRLYGDLTYSKLVAAHDMIAERLKFGWMRLEHRSEDGVVLLHGGPSHPDYDRLPRSLVPPPVRAEVAELDMMRCMQEIGLVGDDGVSPPAVRFDMYDYRLRLHSGITPDDVREAAEQLSAASGVQITDIKTEIGGDPQRILLRTEQREDHQESSVQ